MANTYTKFKLSGSTDGKMIKIVPTSTSPGTATIHTAHATALDEIWLWAVNSDTVARLLTIEKGGVASPDCLIQVTIPSKSGLMLILPGTLLTNSLVLSAFAAAANVIMIDGYVNRIS